jgi:hypothetical protein
MKLASCIGNAPIGERAPSEAAGDAMAPPPYERGEATGGGCCCWNEEEFGIGDDGGDEEDRAGSIIVDVPLF